MIREVQNEQIPPSPTSGVKDTDKSTDPTPPSPQMSETSMTTEDQPSEKPKEPKPPSQLLKHTLTLILGLTGISVGLLWTALLLSLSAHHLIETIVDPIFTITDQFMALDYHTPHSDPAEWDNRDSGTYYERECKYDDITGDTQEEITWEGRNLEEYKDFSDMLMLHGAGIIPEVLSPSTVTELRNVIIRQNEAEPLDKQFDIRDATHRWSLRVHPHDTKGDPDKIIPRAMKEVAEHKVLSGALEKLLGKDPAITEIAAITSEPGADEQDWHHDVWYDASLSTYARTYTGSYSLFLFLQDTYKDMGSTGICLGTHMCSSYTEDISCFHVEPPSGSGMIYNNNLIHQGGGNTAYEREDGRRVVLIITFSSRPDPPRDRRMMAFGSVYGIAWNVWGHTLHELRDMEHKAWNVWHALGLKKNGKNWGWNFWLGSMASHAENASNGVEVEWYLERNIWEKYRKWAGMGFVIAMAIYALVARAKSGASGEVKTTPSSHRILTMYCIACTAVISISLGLFSNTEFARSVHSGDRFRFPAFPSMTPAQLTPEYISEIAYPKATDVLFGERLDAYYLYQNTYFYDYHPGNIFFRETLAEHADGYGMMPEAIKKFLQTKIIDVMKYWEARFLRQNDYGHWAPMSSRDIFDTVQDEILGVQYPLLRALSKEVDFILSQCKYGDGGRGYGANVSTGTAMAKKYTPDLVRGLRRLLYLQAGKMDDTHDIQETQRRSFQLPTSSLATVERYNEPYEEDTSISEYDAQILRYGVWQEINDTESQQAVDDMLDYMDHLLYVMQHKALPKQPNRAFLNKFLSIRDGVGCRNEYEQCSIWASKGYCEDYAEVAKHCGPSCHACF